ncbi:hypothetical protein [uncultured Gilliamella sp.]|uniref:hypothetical protein n=1 Tax=uncultured Gilliamella sp. TaxID=1193505 RepID=UPI0025EA91C8|nr:hypothetical protein [uncultured Gilliamella sp.]
MLKYLHIFIFLLTHDLTELKQYWETETLKKKFTWGRIVRRFILKNNKYLLWYRLAYFMSRSNNKKIVKTGRNLSIKNNLKHGVDISVFAEIGIGLNIWHYTGVVISSRAKIGNNFNVASGVVIGFKNYEQEGNIKIGNNVMIGANSVIFSQNLTIGDNVKIGAMSFINKNIPSNCTVYTEKSNKII